MRRRAISRVSTTTRDPDDVDVGLLEILRCPQDGASLALVEGEAGTWLVCPTCDRRYAVQDGVAVMVDDELEKRCSSLAGKVKDGLRWQIRRIDGAHQAARRFILRNLDLRPSDLFLDVGGGSGVWSTQVGSSVGTVCFLDRELGGYGVLTDVGRTLRGKGIRSMVVKGDARSLPLASSSVDKAVCTEVIEHVDEPNAVVEEIHRVLRHGGKAIITTTPDPEYVAAYDWRVKRIARRLLPRVLRRRTYWRHGFDAYQQEIGHINRISREQLVESCHRAGFCVLTATSLHKRAGMWFEELRWGAPLVAMALMPLTLLIYWREASQPGRGLSPHVAVLKPEPES